MELSQAKPMSARRRILVTQKFSSLGGAQKSLVHHFELLDREKFEAHLLVSNKGWLTDECDRLGVRTKSANVENACRLIRGLG